MRLVLLLVHLYQAAATDNVSCAVVPGATTYRGQALLQVKHALNPSALFALGSQPMGLSTLSQLAGRRYRTAGSSSPALDVLWTEIDSKMKPLQAGRLPVDRCSEMVQTLAASGVSPTPKSDIVIHTGAFLNTTGSDKWVGAARKLRLGILSFLSTQDLQRTQLHFWSDVSDDHPLLHEALRPVLEDGRYANSIRVHKFDPAAEFAMAFPTHKETARLFQELYHKDHMLASRSDLQRLVLLNNYGGMWVDTDVLFVGSLALVAHEDWAYLGQDRFINGAVLSVSKPRSPFARAYLATIAGRGLEAAADDMNIYKFGPSLLTDLKGEVETAGTFHVLPGCFFDGGWVGAPGSPSWDGFFTEKASKEQVAYIDPGNSPPSTLAFHWHGRWDKPIVEGSVGDRAEQLYLRRLQLSL